MAAVGGDPLAGGPGALSWWPTWAELAADAAKLDLDSLEGIEDRLKLAERAAIVVLLLEPVLALLRRLAQENESRRRATLAGTPDGTAP